MLRFPGHGEVPADPKRKMVADNPDSRIEEEFDDASGAGTLEERNVPDGYPEPVQEQQPRDHSCRSHFVAPVIAKIILWERAGCKTCFERKKQVLLVSEYQGINEKRWQTRYY